MPSANAAPLLPGDPAPWFRAPVLDGNPQFVFESVGGRWLLVLLAGSAGHPAVAPAIQQATTRRTLFDDDRACLFGVSVDPTDVSAGRIATHLPGIRWFLDHDRAISRAFGALGSDDQYRPHWVLVDPMLRVAGLWPIDRGDAALAMLERAIAQPEPVDHAPVLIVPRIFEPDLCQRLIGLYRDHGGEQSGFMREVDGRTVLRADPAHKRRADHVIGDAALIAQLRARLHRFLVPMIARAFQFHATRIERFIVACYDGDGDGGYFRPHRDNTTKGTAHRRFAVTINLNSEEYAGGDLRFPEYGRRLYRAPTGGAVVFSCSLLHEATPVTSGQRYAFLPFLYDEAGAAQREANTAYVEGDLARYRAG